MQKGEPELLNPPPPFSLVCHCQPQSCAFAPALITWYLAGSVRNMWSISLFSFINIFTVPSLQRWSKSANDVLSSFSMLTIRPDRIVLNRYWSSCCTRPLR